jgi:phage protein U
MKYASFGDIIFQIFSYQQHKESNQYAVAKLQTVIAPSSLQYLGNELLSLELTINFHNAFCNPIEEYEKLKELAKTGESQKLIIAEKVLGDFVIESIDAEYQQIDAYGQPVDISLNVKFTEYIKKEIQKRKTASNKKKGKAVKKKNSQQNQNQNSQQKSNSGYINMLDK